MTKKKKAANNKSQNHFRPDVDVKSLKSLQKLSLSVGNFIHYWGFRRVHGAIWTQLYLSQTPLSCTDLTHLLDFSKALISPALDELCYYKLIHEVPGPNEKTKLYCAEENINAVIQHILRTREAKMLKQISKDFANFQADPNSSKIWNKTRIDNLGEMILSANLMLEVLLSQKDIMKLPEELEI